MARPPVIILGMHRSGTSMLTRILEKLGLFVGWRKEENNEALFFLKFNDWLLKQAHATWDNPYNYKLAGEDFKELMANLARKYIRSFRRIEFLGFGKFLKYKSLKDLDFPWGWKDPRNTFTLDIWLKVFPNAKIIHIYRNPIDVAKSLRKRALKHKKELKWNLKKELYMHLTLGYIGYGDFIREENIFEGIKLWEEYVSNVFELEKKFHLDVLHIKYEDFLGNPLEFVKLILSKIGMSCEKHKIIEATKDINPQRKYAFLANRQLIQIYKSIKNRKLLLKLDYDNIV